MALDRPVLVTGTPRAGKTCVWTILGQASEFHSTEEPIMIWDAGLTPGNDDRRSSELATQAIKERIVRDCERVVQTANKARYLDNLAHHAVRLPFVHAVLPEARIIHVIRDPYDAIPELLFGWTANASIMRAVSTRRHNMRLRSIPRLGLQFLRNYARSRLRGRKETYGPRVPNMTRFAATHSPEELAAYQWSQMVQIALEDIERLPELQVLEVRYDRLKEHPRGEASRIAEFAEVENPQAVIDFAARYMQLDYIHHECVTRPLSAHDWQSIRPIIAPLQEVLGYRDWGSVTK